MLTQIAVAIALLLVIAWAPVLESRLRVASPLLLVVVGLGVSLVPALHLPAIPPEIVLEGLLPPLLYASARAMAPMHFRRELRTISGLSVVLVIVTSLLLGCLFWWLAPDIGFAWGVALGAIVSPTDAVATSIIKKSSLPRRAVTLLDGESMLNDATALVLLRTAVAATAGDFSLVGSLGTFVYAVLVAVLIGLAIGWVDMAIRRRIAEPTVNTILSFTVPFLASIPAELLNASGLVAAVVAGLYASSRAPRVLPPRHRLSDMQNWASLRLVLEGAIFLTMGLQLSGVVSEVSESQDSAFVAVELAVVALLVLLGIRAGYVAPLLWALSRRSRRMYAFQPKIAAFREKLESDEPLPQRPAWNPRDPTGPRVRAGRQLREEHRDRYLSRARVLLADIDYLAAQPLGLREGIVVVWAGMRGAITVAAAQSLPAETPHRALLVLIAFCLATISLLVQGATIGPVVSRLYAHTPADDGEDDAEQRRRIQDLLDETAAKLAAGTNDTNDTGDTGEQHWIRILQAQREALLDARDEGLYAADNLSAALRIVDADQIALELRDEPDQ